MNKKEDERVYFLTRGRMNRKGDERVLILYWFIIFVIISVAIVSGVISYYGHPIDVREKESEILSDKIISCVTEGGKVDLDALNLAGEEFLSNCKLFFKDESNSAYVENEQYYIEIKLDGASAVTYGNADFAAFCEQTESKLRIPVCNKKRVYVLDNDNLVSLDVLSVIRKVEQNAK